MHHPYGRYDSETRDIIKGTSFGIEFVWRFHNIAYYVGSALNGICFDSIFGYSLDEVIKQSQNLDVGASIFDDKHEWYFLGAMHIGYLLSNRFAAIHDLILHLWRKIRNEEKE